VMSEYAISLAPSGAAQNVSGGGAPFLLNQKLPLLSLRRTQSCGHQDELRSRKLNA